MSKISFLDTLHKDHFTGCLVLGVGGGGGGGGGVFLVYGDVGLQIWMKAYIYLV